MEDIVKQIERLLKGEVRESFREELREAEQAPVATSAADDLADLVKKLEKENRRLEVGSAALIVTNYDLHEENKSLQDKLRDFNNARIPLPSLDCLNVSPATATQSALIQARATYGTSLTYEQCEAFIAYAEGYLQFGFELKSKTERTLTVKVKDKKDLQGSAQYREEQKRAKETRAAKGEKAAPKVKLTPMERMLGKLAEPFIRNGLSQAQAMKRAQAIYDEAAGYKLPEIVK